MERGQFEKTDSVDRELFAESIAIERQEEEEKRKLRNKSTDCRDKTDDLLRSGAYIELQAYYQTKEARMLSKIENDIAIFCIVLSIYQMEQQEGLDRGILYGIHSMEEAVTRYLSIKFLMWKVEFGDEEERAKAFRGMQQASVPFMKYLIHTSSFDNTNTAFKLAMLLKNVGSLAAAFAMLNYTNELSPGEEVVFCEMADICMMTGQYRAAADCIAKISNPSGILAGYQEKWGL